MKERGDLEALEVRLARAWRADDVPGLDPIWKATVMHSVRAASARSRAAAQAALERIVRNAFWAAAAAAILAAVVVGPRASALDPSLELARVLAADPQGLFQLVLVW